MEWELMPVYLDPSGSFRSKEVLRGIAAWCCWRICWHCRRSGPCVGEPRDSCAPAAVGTRCQVVFLLKGVLYSQGVPSLSTLYSTMGMRQSSEQPLRGREGGRGRGWKKLLQVSQEVGMKTIITVMCCRLPFLKIAPKISTLLSSALFASEMLARQYQIGCC